MADEPTPQGDDFVDSVAEPASAPDTQQPPTQPDQAPGTGKPGDAKPDDLRSAMAELARTVKHAVTPQPAEKQLTDAEKAELWGVWDPQKSDPDFFRKWLRLNTDMDPMEMERVIKEYQPLFAAMQTGLVRQSIVGARNLMQIELAKLREELTPMQEYVSVAKAEATRNRFFDKYPSLHALDPESGANRYARVIDATARLLADQTFESEAHYFKALAEGAAEAIKGLIPEFDLGAKPKDKTAVTTPRLPRTRVGGTGGTAAGTRQMVKQLSDDDSDTLDWGNYGKTA